MTWLQCPQCGCPQACLNTPIQSAIRGRSEGGDIEATLPELLEADVLTEALVEDLNSVIINQAESEAVPWVQGY